MLLSRAFSRGRRETENTFGGCLSLRDFSSPPTQSRIVTNKLLPEVGPREKDEFSGTKMFILGAVTKCH